MFRAGKVYRRAARHDQPVQNPHIVAVDVVPAVFCLAGGLLGQFAELRKILMIQRTAAERVRPVVRDVRRIVGHVQVDPRYDPVEAFLVELQLVVSGPKHVDHAALVRAPGVGGYDLGRPGAD